MRRRHHAGKTATASQEEPGLDLSSLIDVSFLLLIFFLVTSTLEPRDADLGLTLPTDGGTPIDGREIPLIEIAADGAIYFSEEAIEPANDERNLPQLKDRLKTYQQMTRVFNVEPAVQLRAHDSVRGQRFTDVVNCFASVGIKTVALEKGEWSTAAE